MFILYLAMVAGAMMRIRYDFSQGLGVELQMRQVINECVYYILLRVNCKSVGQSYGASSARFFFFFFFVYLIAMAWIGSRWWILLSLFNVCRSNKRRSDVFTSGIGG